MAITTLVELSFVLTLCHWSRTSTVTLGAITSPATVLVGSCKKLRLSAAAGLTARIRSCPVELIPPSSTCTACEAPALYAVSVAPPTVLTPEENPIDPPTPNLVPSTVGSVPSGAALRPVKTIVLVPV